MNKSTFLTVAVLIPLMVFAVESNDYPYKPVEFTKVKFTDTFWKQRLEVNEKTTIPFAFDKCEKTNRMKNFELASRVLKQQSESEHYCSVFAFDDTDPYKIIEGASYSLHNHYDANLDKYLDNLIALIKSAQEPDGYLYTFRTMNPPKPHRNAGGARWLNDRLSGSHELYNSGHFYEAAVAHFQATGKRTMLDMAIKNANLIYNTIGKDKIRVAPGHQVIEMGLAKLYRVTGDKRYLELAQYFVDERGKISPTGSKYNQDHKPVFEQDEAVGHAVRAGYFYAGIADVAALTGNKAYIDAIDKIWENVVNKKLYINGGIGAKHEGEAFGENYELPNESAYNETCAQIANIFWNYRMFCLHGDSKYIDVLERTLYNGMISGISLDGMKFFYPNPLESKGEYKRSEWFDCSCCPSNDVRFLASLPGYVYAQKDNSLFVNLFIASETAVQIETNKVNIKQNTLYPWDGKIEIAVNPEKPSDFNLQVRIPCWAANAVLPGDLYTFADTFNEKPEILVNGKKQAYTTVKGYAQLQRRWKAGDKVTLQLPMPVRRVVANKNVKDDLNKVCLVRGPITYCLEGVDNKADVLKMILPENTSFNVTYKKDLLNGVCIVNGKAIAYTKTSGHKLEKKVVPFTAIPYYAWNNREVSPMSVWFHTEKYVFNPEFSNTYSFFKDKQETGFFKYPNSEIYYTLDGKLPDKSALKYNSLIRFDKSTEVKAIAIGNDGTQSGVETINYVKANVLPLSAEVSLNKGINYAYFENNNITETSQILKLKPLFSAKADRIDLDLIKKREDDFQLLYNGYLKITESAIYSFELQSDDGSVLWLEDYELINNDGLHGKKTKTATIYLEKGFYKLKLAYFDTSLTEVLNIFITSSDNVKQKIAASSLYSDK